MNHLVSIVIPAYNRASRIGATLLSVIAQDYENIEIIVVDDASSDNTCDTAESVLKSSGRSFKLIQHGINMGIALSRNDGLDKASGRYVIFFDSDDFADPNFVSVLVETITKNDSDAAFCGRRHRLQTTGEERIVPLKLDLSRKYSAEELTLMYINRKLMAAIVTTIFKTSFLKAAGLEFDPECKVGEDWEFLEKAFSRCASINFAIAYHYVYVQHEGQETHSYWRAPEIAVRNCGYEAETACRSALYVAEYAVSPKVRSAARNYMLPGALMYTMVAAAFQHDKDKYYRTLHSSETRQALKAGLKNFLRWPKNALKAAVLLTVPSLFFWRYSKLLK